jgi:2'-5' RNA ligase
LDAPEVSSEAGVNLFTLEPSEVTVTRAGSTFVPKHGVVSLLDAVSSQRVRRIWDLLKSDFGLHGVLIMPYPHFSYQIVEGYDRTAIEATLRALARTVAPFKVRTTGLQQFEGDWPVVFIAVEGSKTLRTLHERIWSACLPYSSGAVDYYRPGGWVPHITLAHGEERNLVPLPREVVMRIRDTLRSEDFRWEVSIENFALVWDDGMLQKPVATFPLEGG